MLLPVAAVVVALFSFDIGGMWRTRLIVFTVVIVPYTWFGVTVGALFSYLSRKKATERAAAEEVGGASSSL
jgi:hypothetical protein